MIKIKSNHMYRRQIKKLQEKYPDLLPGELDDQPLFWEMKNVNPVGDQFYFPRVGID